MQINFFAVAFFLLLLPGLVCAVIVSRLTTHRDRKPADFLIPSFIYGFFIFVAYQWLAGPLSALGLPLPRYSLIPLPGQTSEFDISPHGITIAIAIGILLSGMVSAAINHKLLHRLGRAIRVTNKFADRDVWSYMMTSDMTNGWIVIRDTKVNFAYAGKVIAYSDEEDTREVVLQDTRVIDNITGEERYNAGIVYFSFPRDAANFEIP